MAEAEEKKEGRGFDFRVVVLHNVVTMTREELKRARQRLRMTQRELAEALGMQTNSVTRMEMGIQPIMRTTELSVKYLLSVRTKTKRGK